MSVPSAKLILLHECHSVNSGALVISADFIHAQFHMSYQHVLYLQQQLAYISSSTVNVRLVLTLHRAMDTESKKLTIIFVHNFAKMLANIQNSDTIKFSKNFAIKPLSCFQSRLTHFATIPCEM